MTSVSRLRYTCLRLLINCFIDDFIFILKVPKNLKGHQCCITNNIINVHINNNSAHFQCAFVRINFRYKVR